jgi:hypothetical protein
MSNKPISLMTDEELVQERQLFDNEIASADRWGAKVTAAMEFREAVEHEQRRRRLAKVRAEQIHVSPFLVDDPGVRPQRSSSSDLIRGPVITGTAKARSEARMPRYGMIGAAAFLTLCLAASFVMAGQRLVELDARYAAMERV